MRILKIVVLLLAFSFGFQAQAQDPDNDNQLDTEVVNVVKPYTPTISDAFKIKETPSINDSVTTQKKDVKYSIFSVPVASTFTPAKGTAADVERAKKITLYDNYVTLGFGNYTTGLGELYSNWQLNRTDNFGIFLRHNSAQGDINDVPLDAGYSDTTLDLSFSSFQKDMSYDLNLEVGHQLFNWYGINTDLSIPDDVLNAIDPTQTYFSAKVGGGIAVEDSFFNQGRGSIRFTSDAFSSSEIHAVFNPQLVLPITEYEFLLDLDLDFLSGKFERGYFDFNTIDYGFLNLGASPALVILKDDLTLNLGVAVYYSQDLENSNGDVNFYPRVRASYRVVDELLIAYGGIEGDLKQNTYFNFKEDNPFVSPTLMIAPTDQLYDAYVGLKGKLASNISYNVRGGYVSENNRALFVSNSFKGASAEFEGYEFGNSFQVVYDDLKTLNLFGELKVAISPKASLGINATYYNYDGEVYGSNPFNLPEFKAAATVDVAFTDKLSAGLSLFYVGERSALFSDTSPVTIPVITTLDSYFDANIYGAYRINDRVSIFVKGSNLTGVNYQKWLNTPVQGFQVLAGATYKFNW